MFHHNYECFLFLIKFGYMDACTYIHMYVSMNVYLYVYKPHFCHRERERERRKPRIKDLTFRYLRVRSGGL